jgi:hypothetical protein
LSGNIGKLASRWQITGVTRRSFRLRALRRLPFTFRRLAGNDLSGRTGMGFDLGLQCSTRFQGASAATRRPIRRRKGTARAHAHDLQPYRVAADTMDADARRQLVAAIVEPHAPFEHPLDHRRDLVGLERGALIAHASMAASGGRQPTG